MIRISSLRAVTSFAWSFFTLSVSGLWKPRVYDDLAGYYLLAFQIFALLTLTYFWYFIFGQAKNARKRILLIAAGIIFIATWIFIFPASVGPGSIDTPLDATYDFYVTYGMVLAHVYKINWFFMDWGVWLQCITVYAFGFYLYIAAQLMDLFIKTSALKTKKK